LSDFFNQFLVPGLLPFIREAEEAYPNSPHLPSAITHLSLFFFWRWWAKREARGRESIFSGEEPGANWPEGYKRLVGYMVGIDNGDASPFLQVLAGSDGRFRGPVWKGKDLAMGGAVRVDKKEIISFETALERLLKMRELADSVGS